MSIDREHAMFRAVQFAGLLVELTTPRWPDRYKTDTPAPLLVMEHNGQFERLAFIACELDTVLQELRGEE